MTKSQVKYSKSPRMSSLLSAANEWMTFMPPCSDCKVVHSKRTLWVQKTLYWLVKVISLSVGMIGGVLYTVCCCHYDVESKWLKCHRSMVSDYLSGVHDLGLQWDLEMFDLNCGALRFWQEPGAGKICTGYFCQEPILLWFALHFKPPISSPMPIRVWNDSILCKHILSISSGHSSERNSFMKLLTEGCASGGSLQQKLCSVPACQDVVWSNLQMAHWCSLSFKVTFCVCCFDRFLHLNGMFLF